MNVDYPELRAWLANQENFQNVMKKNAWLCTIVDKEAMSAVQMLKINNQMQPSSIVVKMQDNSFKEFWLDVYEDEQNVPYDIRLPTYSEYYLIY